MSKKTKPPADDFKPCPFCGWFPDDHDVIMEDRHENYEGHQVLCFNCGITGPMAHNQWGARVLWNHREKAGPTA